MIQHMVCLKFESDTTVQQKDEVIRRLRDLKTVIPNIQFLACNYNFSSRNQGYDVGLFVQFESEADLATYGPHPAHQAAVQYMKENGLVDTLVIDFAE